MARAAQQTEQAMGKIINPVNLAKDALAGLGVGLSVGAFALLVKGSIDAADNLRDMSQKTGVAVETLNGLGFAAGQAGGDLASIGAAAGKVNKAIVEAAGGNKDTGEAFSKLGISVRDSAGDLKKADVIIAEVADKFKGYADGPEKSAIALRIFGKAGADMIPLLNDGGEALRENIEYAKQYSGITTELTDAADNFNDTMGKLAVQQKGFGNAMATALLPILQSVANEILGASEQSDKFALATDIVRTVLETFVIVGSEVAFTFKAVGSEIGGIIAQVDRLAHGDIKGFTAISDMMAADAAKARKEHDEFIAGILDRTPKPAAAGAPGEPAKKPPAPRLRAKGDDPTKALLDGQLKVLEDAYARERDTASFQDKYMQELRAQDLVDVQTFERFKVAAIAQGLAAAERVYDAEIAALEKSRRSMAKETDRAEVTNKIKEKTALKEKARIDAAQAGEMQLLSMTAAQSGLNKSMTDWGIQQDQAASQLQFTNDLYGKSTLEVAKLTDARRIELDIEEKIRLAKEKGAITDEAIANFRKAGAAKSATVNAIVTQAAGKQIGRDQRRPDEAEKELHDNTIKDLRAFQALKLENVIEGNRMIEFENTRHAQAQSDLQLSTAQTVLGIAESSAGQLYDALKAAGMEQTALGKAMFFAQKAVQVATIIVNTEVAAAAAQAGMIAAAGATAAVSGPAGPAILAAGIATGAAYATITRAMGYATAGLVAGTALAGAREKGGSVWDGGAFLVGEKGPEIFRPPSHGTIVPNSRLGGGESDIKFTIVNQTTGRIDNVVEQRISPTERALIIQESVAASAAQMGDPNSKTSRAMSRNFNVPRSR
jgi:hypothetical protein